MKTPSNPTDKYPSFAKEGTYTVEGCRSEDEKGLLLYEVRYKSDVHDMTLPFKGKTKQEAVEKCRAFVRARFLGVKR